MVDKKTDEKEALELKKIYNRYHDKRKEIIKNTHFKVEDVFGVVINKNIIRQDQIIKLGSTFSRRDANISLKIKSKPLNLKEKKRLIIYHLLLPNKVFSK